MAFEVKSFGGDNLTTVETNINSWLATLTPTAVIERSETAVTAVAPSGGPVHPVFVVMVWYRG